MEFRSWVLVSLLAGIGEECAYRGTALNLLTLMGLPRWDAVFGCTIAFAVSHLYQGWKSVVRLGVFALLSHLAVFVTGSLYLSITVHVIYDLLVGWLFMRLVMREHNGSMKIETAL